MTPLPLTSDLSAGQGMAFANGSQEVSVKLTVVEGSVVSGILFLPPFSSSAFIRLSSSPNPLRNRHTNAYGLL